LHRNKKKEKKLDFWFVALPDQLVFFFG